MSHEIRTPVAAIIGYGDILPDPDMNASERLECINTVRRNGMHLLTLINDILDLSKVEAGRLHVEQIECNPCLIIGDVASMMRVRAAEKNLSLEIRIDGVIPERIRTDPMPAPNPDQPALQRHQVHRTGLGAPGGPPRQLPPMIKARYAFDVIDTGMGMTPAETAHIFQPFVQGDASTTRRFGGTGLGLSISRKLAEFLGGSLTVDSAAAAVPSRWKSRPAPWPMRASLAVAPRAPTMPTPASIAPSRHLPGSQGRCWWPRTGRTTAIWWATCCGGRAITWSSGKRPAGGAGGQRCPEAGAAL